ncbi:hypothetical protein, partial [Stutzerimonas nitrititolerans]|uniref:hypothetical protein n=1 Tax=Stutzerimonas nitrititolerans TaxID=2482751 RepID=UPI0028A6B636
GWRDRRISPDSGSLFQTILRGIQGKRRYQAMWLATKYELLACCVGSWIRLGLGCVHGYLNR